MAAHSGVPALDEKIASLSQAVMEKWLREEMGFNGIIISDDFTMAAAGGMLPEEAAVHSVISGADMILVLPKDLSRTHEFFLKSLENGLLSRERLINAAQRIIYEKIRMNLISERKNG
jgi:beta-N-acetylhexosaminidase